MIFMYQYLSSNNSLVNIPFVINLPYSQAQIKAKEDVSTLLKI